MKKIVGISAFLFLCLALVPCASANLIINPSFEYPSIDGSTHALIIDADLEGWLLSGADQKLEIQRDGLFGVWANPYGRQWAELDGNQENSTIFQSVNVTAGTPYHFEFYYSPRPLQGSNADLLFWSVSGSGVNVSGNINAPYGSYLSHPVWSLVSIDFTPTADGDLQILFAENGPADGFGMLLDSVSLNAVPLPAAAWLLGTGLLGLVLVRRRR
jgi:hypothetical protein